MDPLSPGTMLAALADSPADASLSHASPLGSFLHPTPAFLALILCLQVVLILGTWLASKAVVHADAATFKNALNVWLWSLLTGIGCNVGVFVGLSMVTASRDPLRIGLIQWGGLILSVLLTFLIRMKVYVIGFLRSFVIVMLTGIPLVLVMLGFLFTVMKGAISGNTLAWMQAVNGQAWSEQVPGANLSDDRAASNEIDRLLNTALHPTGPTPSLQEHEAMAKVLQEKLQARRDSLPAGNARESAVFHNQLNRYLYFCNLVLAERSRAKPATPVQSVRTDTASPRTAAH